MWLRNRYVQMLSGTFVERLSLGLLCNVQMQWLGGRKEREISRLLCSIRKGGRSLQAADEAFLIYSLARAQTGCDGDFAEVGVFRGGSARLMCEMKGDKQLHLFDTFEGLPPAAEIDRNIHRVGQYCAGLESVRDYLKEYDQVYFHKGLFPDSTAGVEDRAYALVHFDVDLYEGTKACFEYFYPRMAAGGVMISHDYDWASGVRKAVDEFFADKPEPVIELPTTQCMIVKAAAGRLVEDAQPAAAAEPIAAGLAPS